MNLQLKQYSNKIYQITRYTKSKNPMTNDTYQVDNKGKKYYRLDLLLVNNVKTKNETAE